MCCPPEEAKPTFQEKSSTCQYLFDRKPCITGQLRCPSLFFFGQFLRSFLSGCSDSEYQRVFHSLVHSCFGQNFWLRLTNLICKKAGELPEEELTVRLFLRRVFLDPLGLPVTVRPTWSDLEEDQTISSPRSGPRSTCSTLHSAATSSSTSFISPSSQLPERTFQRLSLTPHSEAVCNSSDPAFANVSTESVLRTIADESPNPLRSSSGLITSTPIVFSNSSLKINSPRPDLWGAANVLFNILRSYPFVHQARLLFILYGPVHKGKLMWNIMCENTAADVKQLSACFGELGCVFSNMWLSGMWSADDTVAVLNEVTAIPDGWLAENVACLLHAAGPQLSSLAVRCKASRGRVAELAVILTSLCLVQVKIKENLSGLLGLVGDAVSATSSAHRQGFLDALAYAFRGVIVDLYETDELANASETIPLSVARVVFRRSVEFLYNPPEFNAIYCVDCFWQVHKCSVELTNGEDHVDGSAASSGNTMASREKLFSKITVGTIENDVSEGLPDDPEQFDSLVIITRLPVLLPLAEMEDCCILEILKNLSLKSHLLEYPCEFVRRSEAAALTDFDRSRVRVRCSHIRELIHT
nr:unnamed protein product [Spirometra erinaceieuropaei]